MLATAHPPDSLAVLALALAVEAAFGYPAALYRLAGHPVTWIGALIARLDRALNRPDHGFDRRVAAGALALVAVLAATGAAALVLSALAGLAGLAGPLLAAVAASSLVAQRSLDEHVAAVAEALERDGLAAGRQAVSRIVGRDPESLDEAGIARAAIESLAENFSDGIVAPALYLGLAGLPGAALYKAANTADSMIGHRTPRHEAFGFAAAKLDDLVNLPASRLSALLIAGAALVVPGASAGEAWRTVRRDAPRHRSPNAGWPEAAMAGALGLRLAGPRVYGATRVEDHWMGRGRPEANAADMRRALRLYRTACALLFLLALAAAGAALLGSASVLARR